MDKIKAQYAKMTKMEGIGKKDKKSIRWIKTSADTKAFKGNLQTYMKERSKQLGLGKDLGREVAHQQFKLPEKQNFFRKLFNKLFHKKREVVDAVIQTMEPQLQKKALETRAPAFSQSKIKAVLKTPQFEQAKRKASNPNIDMSRDKKLPQYKVPQNNRSLN